MSAIDVQQIKQEVSRCSESLEQVKAAGISITRPDTKPFRKAVAPIYEDFYKRVGDEARTLVNGIIALTQK